MKITAIKTFVCHAYRTNWVFVKVLTDQPGLEGVGEATLEYREQTVVAACQELERDLVGKSPNNIEALWHDAYRDAYWRGGPVLMSARSRRSTWRLWDIQGKELGVPVYRLLGGMVRDRAHVTPTAGSSARNEPDQFAAKAVEAFRPASGRSSGTPSARRTVVSIRCSSARR